MAIDQSGEFEANLSALGIGFSLDESSVGVPIIDGDDVMAQIAGNRPPSSDELTPLPLRSAQLAHLISRPIMDIELVPSLRTMLTDNVRWLINEQRFGLNADEETVYNFRQGASEALQNGVRAGGIVEINLKRTGSGLIYFDVHNLPLDFPSRTYHHRPGQRRLELGRRKQLTETATHEIDEGGWGMYLIGCVATADGDRPPAGLYDDPYVTIPIVDTDQTMHVTRRVSWATYGKQEVAQPPRSSLGTAA